MECPRPAKLKEEQLREIRRQEERLGVILIAYEKIPPYKRLDEQALAKIRALEKETGTILVAYEA